MSGQQSFSFPIWIGNIVISVRVGKFIQPPLSSSNMFIPDDIVIVAERTEPSATWVLIVPGETKLEILREDPTSSSARLPLSQLPSLTSYGDDEPPKQKWYPGITNPPKSRLSSSNSTDSSVDSNGSNDSQQMNQSLSSFAWTKLASLLPPFMQQHTSPPSPSEEGSELQHIGTNEVFPFHDSNVAKKEVIAELLNKVPKSATVAVAGGSGAATPPLKSNSSGIRRSTSGSVRSSHERSYTWGSPSDFTLPQNEKKKVSSIPKPVSTPGLSAHFRVQPYSIPNDSDDKFTPNNLWIRERAFDVFVNPFSLPEVFLSLGNKSSAILVDLVPIESPMKPPHGKGIEDSGRSGPESDLNDIRRVIPVLEKQSVGGSEREQKGLPASMVVRLFFATKIRGGDGEMKALLDGDLGGDLGEDLSGDSDTEDDKVTEIPVEVGHILISDLVRHQLGIAMCSRVILNQVKDEWRIAYKQAPSVHIQPLDPLAGVSPAAGQCG